MLFCKNRAEEKHYSFDVPVADLESCVPGTFLSLLTAGIEIEDGLTVAELFRNLSPFGDVVGSIAGMDFNAFAEEAMKPPADDKLDDVSGIEIKAHITLGAKPKFERREDNSDFGFERIKGTTLFKMSSPVPIVTDQMTLELSWDYLALYAKPEEDEFGNISRGCSLDLMPLPQWSHLPIKIGREAIFTDLTPNSRHLSSSLSILNPDHPAISATARLDGKVHCREMTVIAPIPTLLDTIIGGFLSVIGFWFSPASADEFAAKIEGSMNEIDFDQARLGEAKETGDEAVELLDQIIEEELARQEAARQEQYLAEPYDENDLDKLRMIALLRSQGVRFPDGEPPRS